MRMSLIAFVLMGIFANIHQVAFGQGFCSTPDTSNINMSLFDKANSRLAQISDEYILRIYVHVIRKSDGTGGQTSTAVNQGLSILDADFNPLGIYFQWDSVINYIDNDTYYYAPGSNIFTVNNHIDGIDIYLYADEIGGSGLANGVGWSSEFYVTGSWAGRSLTTSRVMSHEMGHVLFLWHTHHGSSYEPSRCQELADGSNSRECGDFVEDTPADPYLGFNVDENCNWLGTGVDANGDTYDPDTEQIMAYTELSCMSRLTPVQGARMRAAIAVLSHLINATVYKSHECVEHRSLTGTISHGDHYILASDSIVSTQSITESAYAFYGASTSVKMNIGFKVSASARFQVWLYGCSTTGEVEPPSPEQGSSSFKIKQMMQLYPNPAKGTFSIMMDKTEFPAAYSIYSISGKVLQKGTVDHRNQSIEVGAIRNVNLLVKVIGAKNSFIRKLMLE